MSPTLTHEIIGAAIEVHRSLGPGLLESAYETCLAHELALRALPYERQLDLPIHYKGHPIDAAYRIDLLVNREVFLEIKSAAWSSLPPRPQRLSGENFRVTETQS